MLAIFGRKMLGIAIVDQGIEGVRRLDDNIAALAAVAAIRAAKGHIFLAPEGQAPRAAIAGFQVYFGLIKEFHIFSRHPGAGLGSRLFQGGLYGVSDYFCNLLLKKVRKGLTKALFNTQNIMKGFCHGRRKNTPKHAGLPETRC